MKHAKTRAAERITKTINRQVQCARGSQSWAEFYDAMWAAQSVALFGCRLAKMDDEYEIVNLMDDFDDGLLDEIKTVVS